METYEPSLGAISLTIPSPTMVSASQDSHTHTTKERRLVKQNTQNLYSHTGDCRATVSPVARDMTIHCPASLCHELVNSSLTLIEGGWNGG